MEMHKTKQTPQKGVHSTAPLENFSRAIIFINERNVNYGLYREHIHKFYLKHQRKTAIHNIKTTSQTLTKDQKRSIIVAWLFGEWMMKYDIFKGLLFCGVVMGSVDTEGMVEQQLSTANLGTQMNPRTRPAAVNEFVPSPKRPVGIEHTQESSDLDLRLKNGNKMIMEEENTVVQQSSTSSEGDVEAVAFESQSYNSSIQSGDELMEEENTVVQQLPASLSTSSDEQAQYSTSMTFTAKDIEKFYKLSEEAAQKLESVTFEGVDIDQKFVDQFWNVFPRGVSKLRFDECALKGKQFSDLFDGEYYVVDLCIRSDTLTNDDIDSIFCMLSPYSVKKLEFDSSSICESFVQQSLQNRLGYYDRELIVS